MNRDDRQLTDRLRSTYEIEMTDETRDRQLSAISVVLMEPPIAAPVAASAMGRWRHRLAALVVATSVVTPAAVAVAAESSLPGDLLYPVKQVTEDVRSVVDPTVVARHRLDEADVMLDRGFPMDEVDVVLVEADRAITDAGDHPDLRSRWTEMQDHMVTDVADDTSAVSHDGSTLPRDDVDEMRDGTGGPATDEMPAHDGTNEDRIEGTHDDPGSDMGSDVGTNPNVSPGSDMGTNDLDTGAVDGGSDTTTDEMSGGTMPGDGDAGTMTDEMSTDTGAVTEHLGGTEGGGPDQGSGMDEGTGASTGSGHDRNG